MMSKYMYAIADKQMGSKRVGEYLRNEQILLGKGESPSTEFKHQRISYPPCDGVEF